MVMPCSAVDIHSPDTDLQAEKLFLLLIMASDPSRTSTDFIHCPFHITNSNSDISIW